MALPTPEHAHTSWPPSIWDPVAHDQRLWSAWFSGKANELAWAYLNLGANSQTGRSFFRTTGERNVRIPKPGQNRGGLLGSIDRTFWGTSPSAGEKRSKIHVPVAGDISTMSADLLFGKRPRFDDNDPSVADWCEDRVDDDMHATLLEAAELCSGLGGIYLRSAYDSDISDRPITDLVHADAAVPTFRYGKLVSVIFWRVLADEGDQVHRHLEEHDLTLNTIEHAVYVGTQQEIGLRVALADYPDMGPVLASLDSDGRISFPDCPGDISTVSYIPNMRPNRYWRHLPSAAALGRSDYAGVEGLMDAFDETYSSWIRDIRLAKSRLIVPDTYMDDLGPGKGAIMDVDRELFTPLKMLAGAADDSLITANQFKIRFQEHSHTLNDTLEAILRGAGYAPQSFGGGPDNAGAVTATEIENRKERSLLTRAKKLHYWTPGLRSHLYTQMWIDKTVFGHPVTPERPVIVWPEAVVPSLSELGQVAVSLSTAEAASKQTLIQMLHPDWSDDQVQDELARIKEQAAFDVLGRARVMLQGPQNSTESLGQEVQEITSGVVVNRDTARPYDPESELT